MSADGQTVSEDTMPTDVLIASEKVLDSILCLDASVDGGTEGVRASAIDAIAKAILAERERCARLAEGRSRSFDFQKALADHDDMAYGANTSRSEIALAIRGEA